MGFYGHYENQFVVPESELTNIKLELWLSYSNSSLSSLCAALKIVCSGWESNSASFLID